MPAPNCFILEVHRNPDPLEWIGLLAPSAQSMLQHLPAVRDSVGHVILPRGPTIRCSTLLALLAQLPRTSSLRLDRFPEHIQKGRVPPPAPCTNLRSLVVLLDGVPACATPCMFRILRQLPHLRVLQVGSTAGASWAIFPTHVGPPLGPIPLESFTYSGLIDGSACAHIIASSADTLKTLRIVNIEAVSKQSLLIIIPAVVDAAPRLTELALSFPNSGIFDQHSDPLVASLRCVKVLRVSARAHATLWRVARSVGRTRCRYLEMHATGPSEEHVAIPGNVLLAIAAARLSTFTLSGLRLSAETARELGECCIARRVRFSVLA